MKKWAVFILIHTVMAVLLISGCKTADNPAAGPVSNNTMTNTVEQGESQENTPVSAANSGTDQTLVSTETTAPAASDADQSQVSDKPVAPVAPVASGVSQSQVAAKPADPVKNTVTISINCQNAVAKGLDKQEKFQGVVPSDGVILPAATVEITEGETVFNVLKRVTRKHKIHMEYEGSKGTPFIQGINNLYEFDVGPLSGWMFCVNDKYPNYGCGEYKLKSGDAIAWNYTCDLGKDLGQDWLDK
jgi:hypothetical protein